MADYLKGRGVTHIYVTGLAADFCVNFTALDGLQIGFTSTIVVDATRAINEESFRGIMEDFQEKGGTIMTALETRSNK